MPDAFQWYLDNFLHVKENMQKSMLGGQLLRTPGIIGLLMFFFEKYRNLMSTLTLIFADLLFYVKNYLDITEMRPARRWKALMLYFTILISFK